MGLFSKLLGTIENSFKFGLGRSQITSEAGGELNARNDADSDYAVLRVKTPVGDQDATPKFYVDSKSGTVIVKRQADTSASIPTNTAVRGFLVVTTAGTGAAIGDLLYDDGSSSGSMQIITATEGQTIGATDALSGGTIQLDGDSVYIWDEDGTAWVKVGDIGSVTGGGRWVRYVITNAAAQDSTFSIPANSRILTASLEITTPYSGGGTIKIGNATTDDLLQNTTDNSPQAAHTYKLDLDADWGGAASVVKTAVGGAPAAGAGVVLVCFASPLA